MSAVLLSLMAAAPTTHLGAATPVLPAGGGAQTDSEAADGAPKGPGQLPAGRTGGSIRTPCNVTGVIFSLPATILVDTTDDLDVMSSYPACSTWDESGPEEVYELTVPDEGPYIVLAHIDDAPGVDLDVFILGAPCDSDNCTASGNVSATVSAVPGGTTLYVSVDGFSGSSGAGTLTVDSWVDPLIFSDDFESGDTSHWSIVLP